VDNLDSRAATPAQPGRSPPDTPAEIRVRELQAELAEERQRLADVLEVSSGWIWEADADLCLAHLAGRFEATTGIAAASWNGRPVAELVSAADGDDPAAEMRARRAFTGRRCAAQSPGGRRYLTLSGKPWFDAGGRFCGYRGVGRDVTEAVEAESRTAALHRRFIEAIESVPASLLLCDPDDRIVICNSATRRYFPRVHHLLVPGTRFEDLVRAQAESGVLDGIGGRDVGDWVAARMMRHRAGDMMTTRPHVDGSWVQVIERRTSDGGIIGIRLDVTELKQREQALAEEHERAQAYARELERSNRELEQFAYIASHDLQEPLRMVASYCQLLQRRYAGKLDPDADEFIEFAVEGAHRMQRLINDLLGYSRVGRRGAGSESFPAGDALDIALANLHGAIAESGARIEAEPLPAVVADRSQVVQLFQNLVGNAIKFHRDDVPVVRVSATAAEGAPAMARFTVADNGIGIAPEYLDRVFLIFQRLHERSKYPGTGIGLAIAQKVVENHGGRIWIESIPGEGSRFQFTLPTARGQETP